MLIEESKRRAIVPFSPTDKAAGEALRWERTSPMLMPNAKGRLKCRAHVCPARIFGHHPDRALRRLAEPQAEEQHAMWGPCKPWLQPKTRRTISAISEPKPD